ncbi:MAG: glutamine synthetase III [Phycisphaerales bacterium]|nr:glutamine synthetase III [Phycisphaerales bacterium]
MSLITSRPSSTFETRGNVANFQPEPAMDHVRNVERLFGDDYGILTFTGENVRRRLSPDSLRSLDQTIRYNEPLDEAIADEVAAAMKDWAVENGCTHYCHWFQPLTGATAEKHDSFLNMDGEGGVIAEFSGEMLIRSEPDASSFPTGSIRDTWEARGYTAWDPTSPAFISINGGERTLCIPTAFVSWTGESLDQKTPLLRSIDALSNQAMRILRIFGTDKGVHRVQTTLGCEQEYFLVSEEDYHLRPDLRFCGRTLIGADAPKGHQLDDHYFGSIPGPVQAYMADVEERLYYLGIPAKTRHNEVAPHQFELAPLFEGTNLACDHQMQTMSVLRKLAQQHGMVCLLHEKPFAGINGSGKHNNWSLVTDTGHNLLNPSSTGHGHLQFLVFVCAVVRGLDRHADLLRASVASAGNDHRLGANEAPPAILSIYMGAELERVLERLEAGVVSEFEHSTTLDLGTTAMPTLERHPGDRNRTSPFAFIGNRFEFRAVGSTAVPAWPNAVLNTIVAESLDYIADRLEASVQDGMSTEERSKAIVEELRKVYTEHKRVVFNGDNYSQEWHDEAERRGLPNLHGCADALPMFGTEKARKLFSDYSVMGEAELEARLMVLYDTYTQMLEIEARTLLRMGRTLVLPAAIRHQSEVAEAIAATDAAGVDPGAVRGRLSDLMTSITQLECACVDIESTLESLPEDSEKQVRHVQDVLIPTMSRARAACDAIEGIVPDDLWPMPTYMDMLF